MKSLFIKIGFVVWLLTIVVFAYTIRTIPEGEKYLTWDSVCVYDDRQCGLAYAEDMTGISLTPWQEFVSNFGVFIIIGMPVGLLLWATPKS